MRRVGRTVGVALASLLLGVGALGWGLAAEPGTGGDWPPQMGARVQAIVGQPLADRAASAPVRFGSPLAGLLLLVAIRGSRRRSHQDGDLCEAGTSGAPGARLVRKTHRQARRLARRGLHAEAGELLFACNELEKSAALFVEAGDLPRAAEIRYDQNRFLDAAELYVEAGDFASAASIFAQQDEFQRAGECYVEDDSPSTAAEMFEKAGDFARAGELYRDVEFLRHAAQCFVRCSRWRAAAECLDRVFRDEGLKTGPQDPARHAELARLARQAAKLFLRAEDPRAAKDILQSAGANAEAASLAMKLHEFAEAAALFERAGDLLQAAEALTRLGEDVEAARMLGAHHREQGELAVAAEHLERAGDHVAAGDLYRHLEDYVRAGACYREQGEHEQAAEMYGLAGDRVAASESYEQAGRFSEAAALCADSGEGVREAALLEKAGDWLAAGEAYHREGWDDEAIAALQRVGGAGFAQASSLLATIFRSRGQLSVAIKQLRQAIGDSGPDRETLPMFYTLATLYEENHSTAEALELYERVIGIDYGYADVEQRVARVRERLDSEPAPPVPLVTPGAVGVRPGRYEIVGELGRGGMGVVYRAQDTVLDRSVAFKVLPGSFQENPQAVANFLREAKAAARLNHPSIVTVYDAGEQDGRYYIAMEFVDGTTLKEIVRRRGPIAPRGALQVVGQVCEALAYAHEKKVVHRDIKTANVMWTREKKAKIMDFGLAKVVEEVRNHTTVVSGTPYYMSPEQTLGKNIDHRTDIYSLGVAAFELVTGTVPFKDGNIPYHHVHTQPPDVRELCAEVPASVARLIARCLAKDAADRYPTAGAIRDEVQSVLND